MAGDIVILSSSGGMYGIAGVPGARIFCLGPNSNLQVDIFIIGGEIIYYCIMLCLDVYGIVRYGYVYIPKVLKEAILIMINALCLQIIENLW